MFHLFEIHSETAYRILRRLDYAGISVMMMGGELPIVYALACKPSHKVRNIYLAMGIFHNSLNFILAMLPRYKALDQVTYIRFMVAMYILAGWIPSTVFIYIYYIA